MIILTIVASVGISVLGVVNYFEDQAFLNKIDEELKSIPSDNPKQN